MIWAEKLVLQAFTIGFCMWRDFREIKIPYKYKGLVKAICPIALRGARGSAFSDVCEGSGGTLSVDGGIGEGDGAPARPCHKTYTSKCLKTISDRL